MYYVKCLTDQINEILLIFGADLLQKLTEGQICWTNQWPMCLGWCQTSAYDTVKVQNLQSCLLNWCFVSLTYIITLFISLNLTHNEHIHRQQVEEHLQLYLW